MRWFLPSKKEETHRAGLVGINQTYLGISLAYVLPNPEGKPEIKAVLHLEANSLEEKRNVLRQFILEHQLQGVPCVYVLENQDYVLSLVDTPNVAQEERNRAMQWLIREVIDYPVTDAIIDTFELPIARAKDNVKISYVVSIRRSFLLYIASLINELGLILKIVDIPEMALRNIASYYPEDKNGVLLIHLHPKEGKILICKNEEIYLARNVDIKIADFEASAEKMNDLKEHILLEIQRSLDYVNTTYRQGNIAKSILLTPSMMNEVFQEDLRVQLNMPVNVIDLNTFIHTDHPFTKEEQTKNLVAIGGAYGSWEVDMKQNINLYQPEIIKETDSLTFIQICRILGIFLIMLCLYTALEIYRVKNSKTEIVELEKLEKEYTQKLQRGEIAIAPKRTREQMDAEVKKLEEQQVQANTMLAKLKSIQIFSNKGFSSYLVALSNQTVSGLWLTQFAFENEGESKRIKLEGKALTPDLIPKLMDNLSREPIFKGSTFQVFSVAQEGLEEKEKKNGQAAKAVVTNTGVIVAPNVMQNELEVMKGYEFVIETVATP